MDVLLSRYAGGVGDVLSLPFDYGMDVMLEAINGKKIEQLYQRWICGGYDHEMSFEEFKRKVGFKKQDFKFEKEKKESAEETLGKVESILKMEVRA